MPCRMRGCWEDEVVTGADLGDEGISVVAGIPLGAGPRDRVDRQPEAFLGPLGGGVHGSAGRTADDEDVDVAWWWSGGAGVPGGPRPEQHDLLDTRETGELLGEDRGRTEAQLQQLGEDRRGQVSGGGTHQPGPADAAPGEEPGVQEPLYLPVGGG